MFYRYNPTLSWHFLTSPLHRVPTHKGGYPGASSVPHRGWRTSFDPSLANTFPPPPVSIL